MKSKNLETLVWRLLVVFVALIWNKAGNKGGRPKIRMKRIKKKELKHEKNFENWNKNEDKQEH